MNTKWNANFSILGPKNAEKRIKKICYTYFKLWTTMKFGFEDQLFMKKPRKNLQGVLFSLCRSKTPILAKIYIF